MTSQKTEPSVETKFGVPWNKLPLLQFMKTLDTPMIKMNFQIDNGNTDIVEFTRNQKIISFYIQNLIQKKLVSELGWAISAVCSHGSLQRFTIFSCEIKFSLVGLKNLYNTISTVLAAIQETKSKYAGNEEFFQEYQTMEFQNFFLTPHFDTVGEMVKTWSNNIFMSGIDNATSGTLDLKKKWSDSIQKSIFGWLTFTNMFAVISGDFTVKEEAKTSDVFTHINPMIALSMYQGKPKNILLPQPVNPVESFIKLDQYLPDYNTFYHLEKIHDNKQMIKAVQESEKLVTFSPFVKNKYFLSEDSLKLIKNW